MNTTTDSSPRSPLLLRAPSSRQRLELRAPGVCARHVVPNTGLVVMIKQNRAPPHHTRSLARTFQGPKHQNQRERVQCVAIPGAHERADVVSAFRAEKKESVGGSRKPVS